MQSTRPWTDTGDGFFSKQATASHKELIKRSKTAVIAGGYTFVTDRKHGEMLDRGLYLPAD
jgi:hypothetical protein